MARKARMAWFLSTDASRAPSRVPTTMRITPSVRLVTGASTAAASTKKSFASCPHRVIRASGMTTSAGPRNEKPAHDTLTNDCSTALSVFAAAQAFLCLSAWWCSGGFFSQRTAARAQATTTSCCSMNHLEVFELFRASVCKTLANGSAVPTVDPTGRTLIFGPILLKNVRKPPRSSRCEQGQPQF